MLHLQFVLFPELILYMFFLHRNEPKWPQVFDRLWSIEDFGGHFDQNNLKAFWGAWRIDSVQVIEQFDSLSWITAKNILQSQSSLRSTSHSYKEHMYSPMILFTGNGQKLWFHNAITHHNLMWMGEGTILTWYYHTTIRKKDQGKGFKAQPRVKVPQPLNFVTCGFSMWPHQ